MKNILTMSTAFLAAMIVIALSVANRHAVRLALNPFRPDDDVLSVHFPFFAYLLGALMAGVALGGIATWLNQGRWRRSANIRTREARRWKDEAERLARERDDMVTAGKAAAAGAGERGKQLAVAGRG